MATPRSKNSSRSNESCASRPVSSSGYDTREVSTSTTTMCQGCQICNSQWTRQAKIFDLRRPHRRQRSYCSLRIAYSTRDRSVPANTRNTLSRSQESKDRDARIEECEIMRCCILQNFACSNNVGDYHLGMYME